MSELGNRTGALNQAIRSLVGHEKRIVSRTALAKFAESLELSAAKIFAYPAEQIGKDAAFALIRAELQRRETLSRETMNAGECLQELALLRVAALLEANRGTSFSKVFFSAISLSWALPVATKGYRSFTAFKPIKIPLKWVAWRPVVGILETIREPMKFCKEVLSRKKDRSLEGLDFAEANLRLIADELRDFAALVAKLPKLKLPSERQIKSQLSQVDSGTAAKYRALIERAYGVESKIQGCAAVARKLSVLLDAIANADRTGGTTYVDASDASESKLVRVARVVRQVDGVLAELYESFWHLDAYHEATGVTRPITARIAKNCLANLGIKLSEPTERTSLPSERKPLPSAAEEFETWWDKAAMLPPQDPSVAMILQASELLNLATKHQEQLDSLGRIRTELEKIPPIERERILDRMVEDGLLSLDSRRRNEGWLLGEDLVRRGLIQFARDALKPLIPDKSARHSMILADGVVLSADLQTQVSAIIDFAELLLDTKVLSNTQLGQLLASNPVIFRASTADLEAVALFVLQIDEKLGKSNIAPIDKRSSVDRFSRIVGYQVSALIRELETIDSGLKPVAADLVPASEEPAIQPLQTVANLEAPAKISTNQSKIAREFAEVITALQQDPICSRWDSRELMAVIAGFCKKSQFWIGKSYFRTESLRKNVKALIDKQIPELLGVLRFLSREGVVGHLGYKGGTTVASLNPDLEAILNPALSKATRFLRNMTDPQKKGEIVAQIKQAL